MNLARCAVLVGCLLLLSGRGVAQPVDLQPGSTVTGASPPPYAGVIPGSNNPPPRGGSVPRSKLLVTWPGFQMRADGSSRFFLQTTGVVTVTTQVAPHRFVVTLRDTKIFLDNNAHALDTRFFNTPVTRAYAKRHGKDVTFVMEMRGDVTPSVTQETQPSGYNFVFIDFAAGSYLAAAP